MHMHSWQAVCKLVPGCHTHVVPTACMHRDAPASCTASWCSAQGPQSLAQGPEPHIWSPGSLHRYASRFAGRSGTHTDGCLTCWRVARFAEVSWSGIDFNALDLRDNVALLVLLRPLGPAMHAPQADLGPAAAGPETSGEGGPLLLVAQTHLLFNPKRGDIKVSRPLPGMAPFCVLACGLLAEACRKAGAAAQE